MTFDLLSLGLGTIFATILLAMWQRDNSPFDLRHLLIDSKTQRVSLFKLGQLVALVVSSWGFVVLVSKDKLTETYFLGYMTAWTAANIGKRLIDKDKKDGQ